MSATSSTVGLRAADPASASSSRRLVIPTGANGPGGTHSRTHSRANSISGGVGDSTAAAAVPTSFNMNELPPSVAGTAGVNIQVTSTSNAYPTNLLRPSSRADSIANSAASTSRKIFRPSHEIEIPSTSALIENEDPDLRPQSTDAPQSPNTILLQCCDHPRTKIRTSTSKSPSRFSPSRLPARRLHHAASKPPSMIGIGSKPVTEAPPSPSIVSTSRRRLRPAQLEIPTAVVASQPSGRTESSIPKSPKAPSRKSTSKSPSKSPSRSPSRSVSKAPSKSPSKSPSRAPSKAPSVANSRLSKAPSFKSSVSHSHPANLTAEAIAERNLMSTAERLEMIQKEAASAASLAKLKKAEKKKKMKEAKSEAGATTVLSSVSLSNKSKKGSSKKKKSKRSSSKGGSAKKSKRSSSQPPAEKQISHEERVQLILAEARRIAAERQERARSRSRSASRSPAGRVLPKQPPLSYVLSPPYRKTHPPVSLTSPPPPTYAEMHAAEAKQQRQKRVIEQATRRLSPPPPVQTAVADPKSTATASSKAQTRGRTHTTTTRPTSLNPTTKSFSGIRRPSPLSPTARMNEQLLHANAQARQQIQLLKMELERKQAALRKEWNIPEEEKVETVAVPPTSLNPPQPTASTLTTSNSDASQPQPAMTNDGGDKKSDTLNLSPILKSTPAASDVDETMNSSGTGEHNASFSLELAEFQPSDKPRVERKVAFNEENNTSSSPLPANDETNTSVDLTHATDPNTSVTSEPNNDSVISQSDQVDTSHNDTVNTTTDEIVPPKRELTMVEEEPESSKVLSPIMTTAAAPAPSATPVPIAPISATDLIHSIPTGDSPRLQAKKLQRRPSISSIRSSVSSGTASPRSPKKTSSSTQSSSKHKRSSSTASNISTKSETIAASKKSLKARQSHSTSTSPEKTTNSSKKKKTKTRLADSGSNSLPTSPPSTKKKVRRRKKGRSNSQSSLDSAALSVMSTPSRSSTPSSSESNSPEPPALSDAERLELGFRHLKASSQYSEHLNDGLVDALQLWRYHVLQRHLRKWHDRYMEFRHQSYFYQWRELTRSRLAQKLYHFHLARRTLAYWILAARYSIGIPIIRERWSAIRRHELLAMSWERWREAYWARFYKALSEYSDKMYLHLQRLRVVRTWTRWNRARQVFRKAAEQEILTIRRKRWYIRWHQVINLRVHRKMNMLLAERYDFERCLRKVHQKWYAGLKDCLKEKELVRLERKYWLGQAHVLMDHWRSRVQKTLDLRYNFNAITTYRMVQLKRKLFQALWNQFCAIMFQRNRLLINIRKKYIRRWANRACHPDSRAKRKMRLQSIELCQRRAKTKLHAYIDHWIYYNNMKQHFRNQGQIGREWSQDRCAQLIESDFWQRWKLSIHRQYLGRIGNVIYEQNLRWAKYRYLMQWYKLYQVKARKQANYDQAREFHRYINQRLQQRFLDRWWYAYEVQVRAPVNRVNLKRLFYEWKFLRDDTHFVLQTFQRESFLRRRFRAWYDLFVEIRGLPNVLEARRQQRERMFARMQAGRDFSPLFANRTGEGMGGAKSLSTDLWAKKPDEPIIEPPELSPSIFDTDFAELEPIELPSSSPPPAADSEPRPEPEKQFLSPSAEADWRFQVEFDRCMAAVERPVQIRTSEGNIHWTSHELSTKTASGPEETKTNELYDIPETTMSGHDDFDLEVARQEREARNAAMAIQRERELKARLEAKEQKEEEEKKTNEKNKAILSKQVSVTTTTTRQPSPTRSSPVPNPSTSIAIQHISKPSPIKSPFKSSGHIKTPPKFKPVVESSDHLNVSKSLDDSTYELLDAQLHIMTPVAPKERIQFLSDPVSASPFSTNPDHNPFLNMSPSAPDMTLDDLILPSPSPKKSRSRSASPPAANRPVFGSPRQFAKALVRQYNTTHPQGDVNPQKHISSLVGFQCLAPPNLQIQHPSTFKPPLPFAAQGKSKRVQHDIDREHQKRLKAKKLELKKLQDAIHAAEVREALGPAEEFAQASGFSLKPEEESKTNDHPVTSRVSSTRPSTTSQKSLRRRSIERVRPATAAAISTKPSSKKSIAPITAWGAHQTKQPAITKSKSQSSSVRSVASSTKKSTGPAKSVSASAPRATDSRPIVTAVSTSTQTPPAAVVTALIEPIASASSTVTPFTPSKLNPERLPVFMKMFRQQQQVAASAANGTTPTRPPKRRTIATQPQLPSLPPFPMTVPSFPIFVPPPPSTSRSPSPTTTHSSTIPPPPIESPAAIMSSINFDAATVAALIAQELQAQAK